MLVNKHEVVSNEWIANETYKMVVKANPMPNILPGQFMNIRVDGHMLRRPISISCFDETTYTMVYKVVGAGTREMSQLQALEEIDVLGPLGSSFPIHENQKQVLIIGGGVGVPPLLEVAKQYRLLDAHVDVVLGFSDHDAVFYEEAFKQLGCQVYIATMDGSYGSHGTVLDAIHQANIQTRYIYSCGPLPMLKALEKEYSEGYVSFESRMACGIGACMGCVCKDKQDSDLYYRICKEGPVFALGTVDTSC